MKAIGRGQWRMGEMGRGTPTREVHDHKVCGLQRFKMVMYQQIRITYPKRARMYRICVHGPCRMQRARRRRRDETQCHDQQRDLHLADALTNMPPDGGID